MKKYFPTTHTMVQRGVTPLDWAKQVINFHRLRQFASLLAAHPVVELAEAE